MKSKAIFEVRAAPSGAARGKKWSLYHVPSYTHLLFFNTKRDARFVADALIQRYGDELRVSSVDELTEIVPTSTMAEIYRAMHESLRRNPSVEFGRGPWKDRVFLTDEMFEVLRSLRDGKRKTMPGGPRSRKWGSFWTIVLKHQLVERIGLSKQFRLTSKGRKAVASWERTLKRNPTPQEQVNEMKRKQNPLTNFPPPQHVMGGPSDPQVWKYRGIDIEVFPISDGWEANFLTPTGDVDEPLEDRIAYGINAQAALGNARHDIDLTFLGEPWFSATAVAHHALDYYADMTKKPIDRAAIAREIEVLYRQPLESYPITKRSYDLFMSLPLNDRLKVIDEVIDFQERAGLIASSRIRKRSMNTDTRMLKNRLLRS